MAGGGRNRSTRSGAGSSSPRRAKPRAAPRPALGNDPFARGAAPDARPPPRPSRPAPAPAAPQRAAPPPAPPPRPPTPPAPDAAAETRERLAAVERRVELALDGAEERLVELAERAGLRTAGHELQETLRRLLPRLQAGLASALDVVRLLEPPDRLDRFGMDARFAERFAPIAELLYRGWWRTTVRDAVHVPASGPAIVVANHAGWVPWDALVLRQALLLDHPAQRELRPLLDERECALPLVGPIAVRLGAVRASPDAAGALLGEGHLVGVFPEGSAGARKPWRDRYRLQRFGRGGFVKLALRCRVPLVPVAIVGAEEASPLLAKIPIKAFGVSSLPLTPTFPFLGPLGLLPFPTKWTVSFLEPIHIEGHEPEDADDPAFVARWTAEIRESIQQELDRLLSRRRSVFSG